MNKEENTMSDCSGDAGWSPTLVGTIIQQSGVKEVVRTGRGICVMEENLVRKV